MENYFILYHASRSLLWPRITLHLPAALFNDRQGRGSRADEGASRMRIAPGHIYIYCFTRAGRRAAAGWADGRTDGIRIVCSQAANPFAVRRGAMRAAAALFLACSLGRCPWSACIMRWAVGCSFRDTRCALRWELSPFPCVPRASSIFHWDLSKVYSNHWASAPFASRKWCDFHSPPR